MQYNWIHLVSKNTAVDQVLRLLFRVKGIYTNMPNFENADIRTA